MAVYSFLHSLYSQTYTREVHALETVYPEKDVRGVLPLRINAHLPNLMKIRYFLLANGFWELVVHAHNDSRGPFH